MNYPTAFKTLHGEIKKLGKLDRHNINVEVKFPVLKEQILVVLKGLFGVTSREYRIVKLTNSPATIVKVMDHVANRPNTATSKSIAVNI